jgi:UDP-N-acetylglucosamine 2-epimerase (non-hydrolysing)
MNIAPETSVRFVTRPVDGGHVQPGAILHAVVSRADAVQLSPLIQALRGLGLGQSVARPVARHGVVRPVVDAEGLPLTEALVDPSTDSPSERTARVLSAFEALLVAERPCAVVLSGDSDASLACALAASKLGIPIARLGGGLRCHDWSLAEEINRVRVDRLADVLLVDGGDAADTLQGEGIGNDRVHRVGNTIVDSVRRWEGEARSRGLRDRLGLPAGDYVLATLHRTENVDVDVHLARVTEGLAGLARHKTVVFPMHPRTAAVMTPMGDAQRLRDAGVIVTGPLGYLDFLHLQCWAGAILTDSGCVQDEASALGVRCYTLRRVTERAATLTHGTNVLLGDDPDEIRAIECRRATRGPAAIPYWDGLAGERAATILRREQALPVAA